MEITGKTNLFINIIKDAETGNTTRAYTTSLSKKNQDGTYDHISVDVFFAKEKFPQEKLEKLQSNFYYNIEILDGFLSCNTWKDGTKHTAIVVLDAKINGKTPLALKKTPVKTAKKPAEKKEEPTEEDLPF